MNAYAIPGIRQRHEPMDAITILLHKRNTTLQDISIKTRKREIVQMRQILHTILRRHTNWPHGKIGIEIGRKDHASVIHAIHNIEAAEWVFQKTGAKSDLLKLYEEIETQFKILTN